MIRELGFLAISLSVSCNAGVRAHAPSDRASTAKVDRSCAGVQLPTRVGELRAQSGAVRSKLAYSRDR